MKQTSKWTERSFSFLIFYICDPSISLELKWRPFNVCSMWYLHCFRSNLIVSILVCSKNSLVIHFMLIATLWIWRERFHSLTLAHFTSGYYFSLKFIPLESFAVVIKVNEVVSLAKVSNILALTTFFWHNLDQKGKRICNVDCF